MKTLRKMVARVLAVGCLVGLAAHVSAVPFSFGDDNSLGFIRSGEPASAPNEVGYINTLLAQPLGSGPTAISGHTYRRTSNDFGTLPDAVEAGTVRDDTGGFTGIDVTGFSYLLGKYDGPNGGDYVWYVGDLTGDVSIPRTSAGLWGGRNGYGLSHWSLYGPGGNTVPDGGTTAILLGAALTGLSLLRRKLGKP